MKALAPIAVFRVDEEPLIEQAHLVDGLTSDEPETSTQHLHISRAAVVPFNSENPSKKPRLPNYSQRQNGIAQGAPRVRKVSARHLRGSVRSENPRARNPDVRLLVKKLFEGFDAPRHYHHVRIDETDVATVALPDSDVARPCEPKVLTVHDQFYSRELPTHGLDASITGAIVYNDSLDSQRPAVIFDGSQQTHQEVPRVPVDDDYRYVTHESRRTHRSIVHPYAPLQKPHVIQPTRHTLDRHDTPYVRHARAAPPMPRQRILLNLSDGKSERISPLSSPDNPNHRQVHTNSM